MDDPELHHTEMLLRDVLLPGLLDLPQQDLLQDRRQKPWTHVAYLCYLKAHRVLLKLSVVRRFSSDVSIKAHRPWELRFLTQGSVSLLRGA